jgi:hypothetical protein
MKRHPASRIKLLVVLSDIHAGSTKALLPPGFVTLEGQDVGQNVFQRFLWECWLKATRFIDETVGVDEWALILNGDLLEGVHHGTKEIISPEVADHRRAAMEILRPLAKRATKVFVVRGTECHVNNHEVGIGEELGAVKNPETGLHAFDRLTIDVNGVRCVFRHHIPTTVRRSLSATQLSVQLAEEQLEAVNNGEPIPRVVGCAHRHKPDYYEGDNGLCFVSPPWQVLTRHGHKVVSPARCKPGVQILDWRGRAAGELPRFHKRYYEAPQPQAIAL